jgi:hypothetical protein
MYSLGELRDAISTPRKFIRELNRLVYTDFRRRHNDAGVDLLNADWDNLLVLDACRYDVFEKVYGDYDLPGELRAVESRASATMEYLKANFDGRDARDTVYVSGTTMLYREAVLNDRVDLDFHDIVDVWREGESDDRAPPSAVRDATLAAADQYPNKRLLVHFIQPHIPFLGEFGRSELGHIDGSIWRKQRRGEVSVDDEVLWQAYEENLHEVLPDVVTLVEELDGKTVVTADHAQLFGERLSPIPMREYGHPNGIYHEKLVTVPWLEVESGRRRRVVSEPADDSYSDRQGDAERAREHLADLGYIE